MMQCYFTLYQFNHCCVHDFSRNHTHWHADSMLGFIRLKFFVRSSVNHRQTVTQIISDIECHLCIGSGSSLVLRRTGSWLVVSDSWVEFLWRQPLQHLADQRIYTWRHHWHRYLRAPSKFPRMATRTTKYQPFLSHATVPILFPHYHFLACLLIYLYSFNPIYHYVFRFFCSFVSYLTYDWLIDWFGTVLRFYLLYYCIIILCFSYLATWLPFLNKPIDWLIDHNTSPCVSPHQIWSL